MTETNNRAIIYARLACKDKWTDTRLDAQAEAAKKLANEHGLAVDNAIVEVASGSSIKQRPGLRAVLEQAKVGQVVTQDGIHSLNDLAVQLQALGTGTLSGRT